jgi:hypothetical protein
MAACEHLESIFDKSFKENTFDMGCFQSTTTGAGEPWQSPDKLEIAQWQ